MLFNVKRVSGKNQMNFRNNKKQTTNNCKADKIAEKYKKKKKRSQKSMTLIKKDTFL